MPTTLVPTVVGLAVGAVGAAGYAYLNNRTHNS